MIHRLRRLHGRLGPAYPRRLLAAGLPATYATGLLATAGTALYVDMSGAEFLRLLAASWLLIWTPEVLLELRLIRGLAPVEAWLAGARDEHETHVAWDLAAGMPLAYLRNRALYLTAAPAMLLWGFYAVWELELPGYSVAIFFVASSLVFLYWVAARFLSIELTLRPVLEEMSPVLPEGCSSHVGRVPLRWRLLVSLSAVTLITGLSVGGFSADQSEDLEALGLALTGSAVAGILVSSWLIGLLSASITTPVGQLREAALRVGRGDLSARVPIAATDETAELAEAFNQMVEGLVQRERLREAFGTFVDPELADRVLEEGVDLAGEELDVSVLFLDIRDFTAFAEDNAARQVVQLLNELFEQVVPVIVRRGGHANKFIGDGLMAVFGAPHRTPDHAQRAVEAGLEIVELVASRRDERLAVGVGINSGPAVVGTVGGGGRLDFTVIGDTVNTAARAESATRETGDALLITDATRSALSDPEAWVARPRVTLKGKSRPVRLYAPAPERLGSS